MGEEMAQIGLQVRAGKVKNSDESDDVKVPAIRWTPSKDNVKLLPLPQPPVRARTDARTNPSAQRAIQLRSVLARVYAVSIQNQITTTVP
jgi:hypothetical protein